MGPYLKIYSRLTPQELRQLKFKEKYKKLNPSWDDSQILLCHLFKRHLVSKMKVLDAGCGHGNLVIDEFRSKIEKAVGVDINKKSTAKNICLDKIVIANLEKLPFKNETFDVVLSLWVVEHLKNPFKVFQEIHRVLKKNGTFLFVTPNKYYYLIWLKRFLSVFFRTTDKLTQKFYGRKEKDIFKASYPANTQKDLEKLLKKVGFKKRRIFYNGDPSYIAFNNFLFYFGVLVDRLPRLTPWYLAKPHLIGEVRK